MANKGKESKEKARAEASLAQNPTVEELAARLNVPPWQMAGLLKAQRWAPGKRVTEREFKAKLTAWLNGPMAR